MSRSPPLGDVYPTPHGDSSSRSPSLGDAYTPPGYSSIDSSISITGMPSSTG
jgi:hypothetical protein